MHVSRARIGWIAAGAATLLLALWVLRPRAIPVETAVVDVGPLQVTLEEDGLTRVMRHVEVAAPVSGRLTESPLEAGDSVTVGAVVGILSPAPLDPRAKAEAEAALASARSLRSAAHALVEQAAVARDEARRDRERAEKLADLRNARPARPRIGRRRGAHPRARAGSRARPRGRGRPGGAARAIRARRVRPRKPGRCDLDRVALAHGGAHPAPVRGA